MCEMEQRTTTLKARIQFLRCGITYLVYNYLINPSNSEMDEQAFFGRGWELIMPGMKLIKKKELINH